MSKINTSYLKKCNLALQKAHTELQKCQEEDFIYEMYRSATIKEFEIVLEQSGKLLKKVLQPYFHTNKEVDKLHFKDIFRQAGHHSLLNVDEVQRWLEYRDNRNQTTHDYGEALANETLVLIDSFISDVDKLIKIIDDS